MVKALDSVYGFAETFDVETGWVIVWHPARASTDVTKPMMVVIFILLTFFFSIFISNDTKHIYFSLSIILDLLVTYGLSSDGFSL